EDVERLKDRKEMRRDPARVAARGLHWGSAVLESGITLIHNGRFYYRGRDVVELAERARVEEVAALLWTADQTKGAWLFEQRWPLSVDQLVQVRKASKDLLAQLQIALPIAAAEDMASYDLRPAAVQQTGARIIRLLTAVIVRHSTHEPIHEALQSAWAPKRTAVAEGVRKGLGRFAGPELNGSAVTARGARSPCAPPHEVVPGGQ